MFGYQIIAAAIREVGVDTVFGVLGDGNFHFVDAWVHEWSGRYVAARHEGGAVNMADGAARVTSPSGLGVATVTHGPGLTNCITALTAATRNRTPLLLLAGDLPQAATRHNQRIEQSAVVASTGADYVRVTTPVGALGQLTSAVREAVLGRRPVVLDVANDVQRAEWPGNLDGARFNAALTSARRQRVAPEASALDDVAEVLREAQRPVILAGRGARAAAPSLGKLGERSGALLSTSLLAKGLFTGDPFDLGLAGTLSTPTTARLFGRADCVIAFGCSLHTWTTDVGKLFPQAARIHVDDDRSQIGDFTMPDHVLIGDAALTADSLAERAPSRRGFRTPEVRAEIAAGGPFDGLEDASTPERIDTRVALIALDDKLPAERMVLSDGGHYFGYPGMYFAVPEPSSFVLAANFGSIGLGLGTAIGAAVARPDRLAVLVVGDGGLLMSLPELETAFREQVRLLVVVVNDAAYGAEVHSMRAAGLQVDTAQFPETDFVTLAKGFGVHGITVRTVADLDQVVDRVVDLRGPLVVDLKVNPDLVAPWYRAAKINVAAPGSPASMS